MSKVLDGKEDVSWGSEDILFNCVSLHNECPMFRMARKTCKARISLCVVGVKQGEWCKTGSGCCLLCDRGMVTQLCGRFQNMEEASHINVRSSR